MKKILMPIDGSARSMKSVDLVRSVYRPEDVEITVLMVREDMSDMRNDESVERAKKQMDAVIDRVFDELGGYKLKRSVVFGRAGEEILSRASKDKTDIIVMTKSTRSGWMAAIGSVTAYVVKYAECIVMIVPENPYAPKSKQRILNCTDAAEMVTLEGQIGIKPNICLLPVRAGSCICRIEVLEGHIRVNHLSYDPDDGLWNLPPLGRQPSHYIIKKDEECSIKMDILVVSGHTDQVKVVNPSMTAPARFHYSITYIDQ